MRTAESAAGPVQGDTEARRVRFKDEGDSPVAGLTHSNPLLEGNAYAPVSLRPGPPGPLPTPGPFTNYL